MNKKGFLRKAMVTLLAGVMVVGVAGCGLKSSQPEASKETKTLVVVNWKDYGSDKAEVVKQFEDKYKCKVVHIYMSSEEELLTKLRTDGVGKIDVVLPNASVLPVAEKENLLASIDTGKLENYQHIADKFKKLPENSMEGKTYAIPWVWGSTAIAYNSNMIKENVDSINVLWDAKYKGQIGFRDDFNDAVMNAAIVLGQNPNKPSDLKAIKTKLLEQKPLNKTYWKTGDEWSKLFANNQIAVGVMWSGQAALMKKEGQPIRFVIPREGAIGWVDNWAIVKNAPNEDLAYKFIDFMLSKEFQENWAKSGGPAPVNKLATAALDPQLVKDNCMDEASLNKLYFISYQTDEVKKAWNELWQEVKAQ
ncbi:ABC transporter substrate-binding protein [Sporomusa sp.]|jgi:spermidine/putrescine transport system substrate-binding protein|uniref:ABC transporter substrate-binding protein n=1 Tax=Sporomusa sp. TaxID=2078658 RepID=UPI0029737BDC|nr:ABC transporter substrate-binding protein [Sporomusa sp.]MDF2572215.1 potD [Sporomusa sp.]HWR07736.1 ABC transporter substrate-binding protein [Sporomusa sp.]